MIAKVHVAAATVLLMLIGAQTVAGQQNVEERKRLLEADWLRQASRGAIRGGCMPPPAEALELARATLEPLRRDSPRQNDSERGELVFPYGTLD
ncbi:MAG TPA: hypothetical protein EYP56_19665 [Planctomycetaceae bacterium]|nr:hypothetical protein [Planctomycetaceae bacterium]